jgi:uncharacterized protein YijF (DUF1287 family)
MYQPWNGSVAFSLVALMLAAPDAGAPVESVRARALADAALDQVGKTTLYDPAYVKLAYPGGDVPLERGVCTDVVARAFRTLGIDLQRELHQDMTRHFSKYPRLWGLARPDRNIDHRRVHNLRTWMSRRGYSVPVTARAEDYWPGDVVTVDVAGLAHIVVVGTAWNADRSRRLVVHNIGAGAQVEDRLFEFPITGHYRPL